MSAVQPAPALDPDKLNAFVFRAVEEVGATLNAALVVMGDKLGLYRAMAGAGPLDPAELAGATGVAERYAREWLNNQAAGGYVEYDPGSGRYTLPPEQAMAMTDADSPAYLPGVFQLALGAVTDSPRITEAARSGAGVGGTSTPTTSSRAASGSSAPATTRASSRPGSPPSTASSASSRRVGPWPTSAAGTGPRRSSWRSRSPRPRSPARTTTRVPSRPRATAPARQ